MAHHDKNFHVDVTISLPSTSKLTEDIIWQFDRLLDFSPPEDYRDTLIEIYHIFLIHEHNTLPADFYNMANRLYFLIDFLRMAAKEMNRVGETKLGEG
jgi:hypothetical protein